MLRSYPGFGLIVSLTTVLSMQLSGSIATAADTPARPAARSAAKPSAPDQKLDLRTPPIGEVMTPKQIDQVLDRTMEPESIEEVEVDQGRLYDPANESFIPSGFASLFWAAGQPSGLWRLFTPRLTQRSRDNINPTNGSQPAPGIPAMSGEPHPYDR